MRIAQLAPLAEAVPPKLYGGTERVVSWLSEALVARGHQVTVFATGDSTTAAELVPVLPKALRLGGPEDPLASHVLQMGIVRDRADDFDVIHSHVDLLGFLAFATARPPVLTTLHGRLDLPGLPAALAHFRRHPLVSISDAQRLPAPDAAWLATVYHGLPVDGIPVGPGRGDYFAWIGRMSPEKRPHAAIRLARRAGVRLLIAAKIEAVDRVYFEQQVKPLLHEPGIEYVGEVSEEQKMRLLGDARALLYPIFWPEPFGLAMVESLACGTPVLTRRCGSTPEIVDDGVVGFIGDDDEDVYRAIANVDRIDRRACRRWVEQRFTADRMAGDYESLYADLVDREPAGDRRSLPRSTSLRVGTPA